MSLSNEVAIGGRFLRSVRIDSDLAKESSVDGFICPKSSEDVVLSMTRHIRESGQGAFTWTGPYGTGKSSLVVALSALVGGNRPTREKAKGLFSSEVCGAVQGAMPSGANGWKVLPVVARRGDPVQVIGEAFVAAGLGDRSKDDWTESKLLKDLTNAAKDNPNDSGGLIIFIDEMGKFLESAAQDGSDIFVLQQLAEKASRSGGRLILIGILHQSFGAYANRLTRDVRDEWTKVQGRFVDLAINTTGGEQVDLISKAIVSSPAPRHYRKLANDVAEQCLVGRAEDSKRLSENLAGCWPLHPIVAGLLGPVSRRRFGQNQRSLFGFLNSAESFGFKSFLEHSTRKSLYTPDLFWNYLRVNLEPSIMGSPDGHKWALAVDGLERCENGGGSELSVKLFKTIAVIDLFKERSGLVPSYELMRTCFPKTPAKALKAALSELTSRSIIIFKKYQRAYAVFAGSDFDIDSAIKLAASSQPTVDFERLRSLAGLQPILAKRHYHETGSLRWFGVDIVSISDLEEVVKSGTGQLGEIGKFLLVIPEAGETQKSSESRCRKAARASSHPNFIIGVSAGTSDIGDFARELSSIEYVKNTNPELAGDPVARREVLTRLITVQGLLEESIERALDVATWFRKGHKPTKYRREDINTLASRLADERYPQTPIVFNELLNRTKPSGTANGAQKLLMKRMILNSGEPRLGISGYPAEGGLYASVLEATGLYRKIDDAWALCSPFEINNDKSRLMPLWATASKYLKTNSNRSVKIEEIFEIWGNPPFGLKRGLMPILAIAFLITTKDSLAIYHDGMFQANFTGLDVDYMVKNPDTIEVRWMSMTNESLNLLSGMGKLVRKHSVETQPLLTPLDVAKGLVAIYDNLPEWTKRTNRMSENAIRIRVVLKKAKDPNALVFDDLPDALTEAIESKSNVIIRLADGLKELVEAYPNMLSRLQEFMLTELQVPNLSKQSIEELHSRSNNVRNLAGDFTLDAFVGRLLTFNGTENSFETIASLAISKPPKGWVDPDLDKAAIEIADLSQKFLRAETFARVKGRPQNRQAMAVMVGNDTAPVPTFAEFSISQSERRRVDAMVETIETVLNHVSAEENALVLAALAQISIKYMNTEAPVKRASA